jgi:hypothetical protein
VRARERVRVQRISPTLACLGGKTSPRRRGPERTASRVLVRFGSRRGKARLWGMPAQHVCARAHRHVLVSARVHVSVGVKATEAGQNGGGATATG